MQISTKVQGSQHSKAGLMTDVSVSRPSADSQRCGMSAVSAWGTEIVSHLLSSYWSLLPKTESINWNIKGKIRVSFCPPIWTHTEFPLFWGQHWHCSSACPHLPAARNLVWLKLLQTDTKKGIMSLVSEQPGKGFLLWTPTFCLDKDTGTCGNTSFTDIHCTSCHWIPCVH